MCGHGAGPLRFVQRFDHVGSTVADLDAVAAFFVSLGLHADQKMAVEGEFLDTVIAAVEHAAAGDYGPVGGIGEYEGSWRMAYVRGPEGIIVSLAERIQEETS